MADRPILFSGPMVRAILEGHKTVTRRPVRISHKTPGLAACLLPTIGDPRPNVAAELCPYGQPGDRLWVRETWLPDPDADDPAWDSSADTYFSWSGCGCRIDAVPEALRTPEQCIYREGWSGGEMTWRPSIHMPRWASRILLEISSVQVERLQDITEPQALAEGVLSAERDIDPDGHGYSPCELFGGLWTMINGMDSWNANPWVWVVEFKRVEP
ncbi:hypothetical protein [Pseudomonas japonica]|uniref:hypothetical protein n=1 Tax=Pseudomonas japonica TaxID=256466 RepID=UPI003A8B3FAD